MLCNFFGPQFLPMVKNPAFFVPIFGPSLRKFFGRKFFLANIQKTRLRQTSPPPLGFSATEPKGKQEVIFFLGGSSLLSLTGNEIGKHIMQSIRQDLDLNLHLHTQKKVCWSASIHGISRKRRGGWTKKKTEKMSFSNALAMRFIHTIT